MSNAYSLKCIGINNLLNSDFIDHPPSEFLLKILELVIALGALIKHGELTKVDRRMVEFSLDPMLSQIMIGTTRVSDI